jgi:hypothetical protein
MISGILIGQLTPFLRVLRILGWFPARIDPTTGKYETCIHPIDVAYCIAVNLTFLAANFPTLYYGFQVHNYTYIFITNYNYNRESFYRQFYEVRNSFHFLRTGKRLEQFPMYFLPSYLPFKQSQPWNP